MKHLLLSLSLAFSTCVYVNAQEVCYFANQLEKCCGATSFSDCPAIITRYAIIWLAPMNPRKDSIIVEMEKAGC